MISLDVVGLAVFIFLSLSFLLGGLTRRRELGLLTSYMSTPTRGLFVI